ncbi:MAG: hypothetical protein A2203_13955 [Chromatiales bacterium RIFOXYA1_FULL_46_5]|nr:MAG: hypothetical protein A2203_13955 [Chromatiales bacterium RIFOXYA1_FULL_46_5]
MHSPANLAGFFLHFAVLQNARSGHRRFAPVLKIAPDDFFAAIHNAIQPVDRATGAQPRIAKLLAMLIPASPYGPSSLHSDVQKTPG